MKLDFGEILKATNAEVIKSENSNNLFEFSTDTRTIKAGDIYIPLKGESFDGSNFIEKAIDSGAKGYFTSDKTKIYNKANIA